MKFLRAIPAELTTEECELAYKRWHAHFRRGYDELEYVEKNTWIKDTRRALMLSETAVARRLGIARSTLRGYELSEQDETISLQTLAMLADIMECELVYYIHPKEKVSFSRLIWNKVLPTALKHPWLEGCHPKKRHWALASIVAEFVYHPEFRKAQGWAQRR